MPGVGPRGGHVHLDSGPGFAGRKKGVERTKPSVAQCVCGDGGELEERLTELVR